MCLNDNNSKTILNNINFIEVDIFFIAICLVLVGLVLIPFFLLVKTKDKKMTDKVKDLIIQNNLKIYESENWGNSYIGLDSNQRKILFLKKTESDCIWQLLDLTAIADCQLNEKRTVLKIRNKKEFLLEKLDLDILLKNGDTLVLNFYDSEDYRTENFELARAEKWRTKLIWYIFNTPTRKRAA